MLLVEEGWRWTWWLNQMLVVYHLRNNVYGLLVIRGVAASNEGAVRAAVHMSYRLK
jgi:hypothetical protein